MHNGLKGRDIFKESIHECRKIGMNVVAYFNIWSRWAYDKFPDWRMLDMEGKGMLVEKGQAYGICCSNSPFRHYVKQPTPPNSRIWIIIPCRDMDIGIFKT